MRPKFEILEICGFWREISNITHTRLEYIGYMHKPRVFSRQKIGPPGATAFSASVWETHSEDSGVGSK